MADKNPTFDSVFVEDTRTVTAEVSDAPLHYTPRGNTPISPIRVEIVIWNSRFTHDVRSSITLFGQRTSGPEKGNVITRSFGTHELDLAPEWVRRLAEKHRLYDSVAGRTVVDLPEPDSMFHDCPMWTNTPGEVDVWVGSKPSPFVAVDEQEDRTPEEAERYALAVLAAARHALRLASESSGDGAQG